MLTRAQLRRSGIERRVVNRRVRAGHWQLIGHEVVVTHNGELTREQRWWAGVLHAGSGACLAGLSAAEAGGLRGWERDHTHVLVPRSHKVTPLPWLVVHTSRRLRPEHIHPVREPAQTRMAWSLVSGAGWVHRAEYGCGLLAAGVQQRLVRGVDLREALEEAGHIRHFALYRQVLGDIEGGAQSFAEISLVRLCRRAGLAPPHEQQFRFDRQGRCRYLDAVWWLADGSQLVLEIDGGLHIRVGAWWHDMARERDIVIRFGRVLRCSTVEIRLRPDAIAADLARAGVPPAR